MLSRFLKPRYIAPALAFGTGGGLYYNYGPKVSRFSSYTTIMRVVDNNDLTPKDYMRMSKKVNQRLFWYARSVENDDVTSNLMVYGDPEYYKSELLSFVWRKMPKSLDSLLGNSFTMVRTQFGYQTISIPLPNIAEGLKEAIRLERKEETYAKKTTFICTEYPLPYSPARE